MTASAFPLTWPAGWPSVGAVYEVSHDGHIFSVRNGRARQLAEHPDTDGYLCVLVRVAPGKRRQLRVHRAVCEAVNGPRPSPLHKVRHWDGNKRNNAGSNLLWGTHAENEADAIRLGEKARGERNGAYTRPERRRRGAQNGNSKLTEAAVRLIVADDRAQWRIAAEHGVRQTLISQIKCGRIWNHVTGLPCTRRLASAAHPDKPGGSHERMAELNAAQDAALKECAP